MDWGSFIIGIGGIVIAGLSVYLSYKAKIHPYREMLYSKQLEGYTEVIDALNSFFSDMYPFANKELPDKELLELREKALKSMVAFNSKYQRWSVFFPEKADKAFSDFVLLSETVLLRGHAVDMSELEKAYDEAIQASRDSLGTDPLSQGILDLIRRLSHQRK